MRPWTSAPKAPLPVSAQSATQSITPVITPDPMPGAATTQPENMQGPGPFSATTNSDASAQPADKATMLQTWVAQQQRLYRVAAPLLLKNTELCPAQSRRILGFTAKNRYSYSNDFIDVAKDTLNLDDQLQIASVLPGSGAMLAGIKPGDILIAAGGKALPTGANAERASSSIIAESIQGNAPIELTVLNGADTTIVEVMLTRACAVTIDLGNTDEINAFADGRRVMVTRGMLGFVQSDRELAYVLAREIAANIVLPTPQPAVSAMIDRLHTLNVTSMLTADNLLIVPTTSANDAVVEKLAMYMLARAGYGIDGVGAFWERFNAAQPADVINSHAATHSLLSERLGTIWRTAQTIKEKRKNNLPLRP